MLLRYVSFLVDTRNTRDAHDRVISSWFTYSITFKLADLSNVPPSGIVVIVHLLVIADLFTRY